MIDRFVLIPVDEGKAELPMPEPGTLEVNPLNFKVAQIFDQHDTLDAYMARAGLTVKESKRPE